MTAAKRVRVAALLGPAVAVAAVGVFLLRRPPSLLECIQDGRCAGTVAMAGSTRVSSDQLKVLFAATEFRSVAQQLTRSYIPRTQSANRVTFLVAVIGGQEQAFPVPMFHSDDGGGYLLGPLIVRLLSISVLMEHPKMELLGDLYRAVASKYVLIQPALEKVGISRIDIDGKNLVSVREGAAALRQWASFNDRTPIRVFRP